MRSSHHHTIRTISCILAAGAIGWVAFQYTESTSLIRSIKPDIQATLYNARNISWNLATTTNNLATLTETLNGKHGIKELFYNVNVLTAQAGRTSTTVEIASRIEQQKISDASDKALVIFDQLGELLKNTDSSLNSNSGVLPAVVADLRALDGTIGQSTRDIHSLLEAGTGDMKAVGEVISDPAIKASLKNVEGTTAHLDSAMGHANQSMAYIQADLAPQHLPLWKELALMALSQAVGIPLKFMPSRVAVVSTVPASQPITVK